MKYKVIIIDDEPWTREVIKELGQWEKHGMKVVGEASDGLSGLDLTEQLQPDIILTDIKMPGISGLELLEALREKGCNAQTIVISGHNDFEYIRRALKLKVKDYLLKPVKPDELNTQLEKCAEQLKEEWHTNSASLYDACGFMGVGWIKDYTNIRNNVYENLQIGRGAMIKDNFDKLKEIIIANEGKEVSSKLLMSIFYDFMHTIETFIVESGYQTAQVFRKQNISFVFRQKVNLNEMFDFMLLLYINAINSINRLKKLKNKVDIAKIKEYVDANYTKSITLERVADTFFISKEYLSKIFKQYNGESFSSYITKKRMEKAYELICKFDIPIKKASLLTGYKDQAHFYKMFKKHFGKTPGEIKKDKL